MTNTNIAARFQRAICSPASSERRGCRGDRLPLQFRACSDAIRRVQPVSKSIGDCRAHRV